MDWSKIMRDYKGKWVALADDEKTVIASAEHAIDASNIAKKKGYEKPHLLQVPKKVESFAAQNFSL